MTNTSEPRLRGNTFLLLLIRAGSQELSGNRSWGEKSNGVTRPAMFEALLKMISPTYAPPVQRTLGKYFSSYLGGTRPSSPTYYPFSSASFSQGFTQRLRDEYPTVLREMDLFCRKYLDFGNRNTMRLLVAGIIATILEDPTTSDSFVFKTGYGERTRDQLKTETQYILQPFLLSVWHYIVLEKWDSSEAKDAYLAWTKDAGANTPREITTAIGNSLSEKITVSTALPTADKSTFTVKESPCLDTSGMVGGTAETDEADAADEPRVEIYETVQENPQTQKQVFAHFHVEAKDNGVAIGQVFGGLMIGRRGKDE